MAGNPVLLIVDDSRVMRVSLKKILKEDFEVIEAVDGEDAWDKLQAEPGIQGIFSDLSMPNLDGYGLLERVRGSDDARIRELPFIVITGKEGELDDLLAEVKDRGANDLVGKPFKSDDIIQRTKSFLAGLPGQAAPADEQEEQQRLAAEAEAQRKAEEAAARLRVEQERRAAEEQARREAAEAQRRAEEQQRAAAEAARLRAEQERQAAAAAERQRLAAEEQARREAEEAARLRAEQERQAAAAAEQARREAAEAAKRAEEEAEQARLAAQAAARIRAEEQKQVEKFREAARLAAEARAREEEARLRFSPAQAFFVRLALPFMEWTNKIFRRNRDEQIAALKKRLPK